MVLQIWNAVTLDPSPDDYARPLESNLVIKAFVLVKNMVERGNWILWPHSIFVVSLIQEGENDGTTS